MTATQDRRLLKINTPLGKDHLLLNRIVAEESISGLYSIEVELLHEETTPGADPTAIDEKALLGNGAAIAVTQRDGTHRFFHGIVNQFVQGERNTRFSFYYATIVPHVWILTQRRQSRIFQEKSVPDILKDVLTGIECKYETQGDFQPRNYCVQYNETDFEFISRLMEEEGIYYYFEHQSDKHTMIIANTPSSHRQSDSKHIIPHRAKLDGIEDPDFIPTISSWKTANVLQSGKVTFWDHHFQLPKNKLDSSKETIKNAGDNKQLEIYEFPGGYARKYDGISSSGGEQPSKLNSVFGDKSRTAEHAIRSLDAGYEVYEANSDCPAVIAGHKFTLSSHKDAGDFVITKTFHKAEQNPSYVTDDNVEDPYENSFSCISMAAGAPPFCPVRKTPKPVIYGSQTAFVVGPAGEEIFTDKFGRVKVQFHWDREGQLNASSSCWVRVAQSWAGNRWGMMFIPRIGMEVIVHFLEGDPDQPIITDCVYNADAMPPYTLPDEKSKSTIKSDSTKGGNGFNEIRLEDKKGSEQIFVHGEKDLDIRIKNDAKELIQKDRHLIVNNDQLEKVKKDKHLEVGGDRNEKIGGSMSLKVSSDIQEKAGQNYGLDAGTAIHLKAGMSVVLEAGTALTLKVGGNFININSGGVFIKGSMVMINSGGAAGSGAGSNPDIPKAPTEADKAEPGNAPNPPRTMAPPPKPNYTSPAAKVLIDAAENGTAFCEVCSRQN